MKNAPDRTVKLTDDDVVFLIGVLQAHILRLPGTSGTSYIVEECRRISALLSEARDK